jgi:hypothetical protein
MRTISTTLRVDAPGVVSTTQPMNMDNPKNRKAKMGIDVSDRYIQGEEYLFLQYLNPVLHFLLFFQLQVRLLGGTR